MVGGHGRSSRCSWTGGTAQDCGAAPSVGHWPVERTDAMPTWAVELTGTPSDLQTLVRLNVGVRQEEDMFVFRDPDLDALPDVGAARACALELVRLLNGLALAHDAAFRSVEVAAVEDGTITPKIHLSGRIEARAILTGDLTGGQPGPAQAWRFAIAKREPAVKRALDLHEAPSTPVSLGRVYDVILDDMGAGNKRAGKKAILHKSWATRDEIAGFRGVHYPSVFGGQARHGVDDPGKPPPAKPMSLPEAQAFVSRLLTQWIDWKGSQP